MKSRKAKIIVDIFMFIFVVLSYIRWSGTGGLIFHSVVGTVFTIFVIAHLYLNRKWVVAVTKSIKEKKANKKVKRLYIVDVSLMIVWGIAIITGFLAIPSFAFDVEAFGIFGRIHAITVRLGGVLIIVHIIQHLGQIRSYFKIKKKATNTNA